MKQNVAAEKKIMKEITNRQEADRKAFDTQRKKDYKTNKERWKRELLLDESTPKRQKDAALQLVFIYYKKVVYFKINSSLQISKRKP